MNSTRAKTIFSKRNQSIGSCSRVTLGQRTGEPIWRDLLHRGRIFFPDGIDRLMQRPRVSFPIQFEESAAYFYIRGIRLDCQRAIPQGSRLSIAPQTLVVGRRVPQDTEIARIQLESALE